MLQPTPAPASTTAEWLRSGAGRRALAIGLALLIETLLILLLLTFSAVKKPEPEEKEVVTVTNLTPVEAEQETPDPGEQPQPADRPRDQPLPRPTPQEPRALQPAETAPVQPAQPNPAPAPPIILPAPFTLPSSPSAPRTAPRPAPSTARVYGPPDLGGSPAMRDSAVVGRAPNGEPLYAAAWHREPRPGELSDYLSTANSPGWGLIACRTAPNYRVVDCVPLDETPGSQINRAILAAAWEFQVRPPRRGGQYLVGAWVRIRIDYRVTRAN